MNNVRIRENLQKCLQLTGAFAIFKKLYSKYFKLIFKTSLTHQSFQEEAGTYSINIQIV